MKVRNVPDERMRPGKFPGEFYYAVLKLADGDAVCVESDEGEVTGVVTIKAGIRQGVLECMLFRKRREILLLSRKPAKVIDVSVRKA